jgi:hypothetical protein
MNRFIEFNFKIILYNVLSQAQIDELSNIFSKVLETDSYIEVCSTMDETIDSINKYREENNKIIVACRQMDYEHLTNRIAADHIDMIYTLNKNAFNAANNNNNDAHKMVANETELQFDLMLNVRQCIRAAGNELQNDDRSKAEICFTFASDLYEQMENFNRQH